MRIPQVPSSLGIDKDPTDKAIAWYHQVRVILPTLFGMIVSTELDVVVETLLLLPLTGKVVGLRPAGAKKDKGHDKNNSDLFHILSLSAH